MPAVDPGIGTSHYLSADNLPAGTSETDIRVQFAFFGPITSVRLNSDGRSAQVEFMSEKDAAAAYESFSTDPLYIEDHKIHIKYYSPSSPSGQYNFHPPSRRVFVANMPLETTEQDIHETFAQFGVIRSVHLIDNSGGLRSRPFGWVTFAKREAAAAAVGANLRLFHHLLRVDYAAPLHQGNIRAVAPPSSHLFVGGLSLATSEAEVRQQFEHFGPLRSIRLRKGADFAHVEFMKQEHAVAAYETFLHEPLYVHGRKIRMNYAPERPANPVLPNNRVYFWDFHGDRTALSLLLKGLNPTIKKIHFLRDYGNSRSGIVTFVSVETAAQAIKRLNGLSTPHGPLNLEYAKL
ncbi:hypothetical protein C8R43DRAFT_672207 [Mycena crocata]|nr:hypothetical protein C8R43DRAFT_672207 [Mycena crocata]